VAHPKTTEWGPYIACKLFGFDLIQRYEKALFLDADLLVTGDISGLFEIEEDIAWREVYAVKPQEIFADILPTSSERILMGNAGLYYFNSSLKKYNIGIETVAEAFQRIKDVKKGGNDEKVMAWLAYEKQLSIKELDANVYNSPIQKITDDTRVIHFLNWHAISTKPWKNLAAYLYFEEWVENYQKWIAMGGEGSVDFSKEDYFALFGFDKAKMLKAKDKKIKQQSQRFFQEQGHAQHTELEQHLHALLRLPRAGDHQLRR